MCQARAARDRVISTVADGGTVADELWTCRAGHRFGVELDPPGFLAGWRPAEPGDRIVTEGERLYASRHALNHGCPSLYYTTDDELFPGGQLLASERFTDDSFWQPVPEHHILILDAEKPPELLEL